MKLRSVFCHFRPLAVLLLLLITIPIKFRTLAKSFKNSRRQKLKKSIGPTKNCRIPTEARIYDCIKKRGYEGDRVAAGQGLKRLG